MSSSTGFKACMAALALTAPLTSVLAAPTPQPGQSSSSWTFPGWAGAAGDDESGAEAPLRGGASLLGPGPNELNPSNSAVVPPSTYELAPGQSADANLGIPFVFTDTTNPQPLRGTQGATDPGPRTLSYDKLNPDLLAPPGTDSESVANPKWPMGLSHNRLGLNGAGWARQENIQNLPVATAMAGVDMRLAPWAYRELHWHTVSVNTGWLC
jgi:hypothetical protein